MDLLQHIELCRSNLEIKRIDGEHRFYEIEKSGEVIGKFPSITTILSHGSDKSFLEDWKKRVGEKEAERISRSSRERGTVMHRLLELHLMDTSKSLGVLYEQVYKEEVDNCLEPNIREGLLFFEKFLNNPEDTLSRVKQPLILEGFHYCPSWGGFAGTCDSVLQLSCGKVVVVDFKNSRKPKRSEWIEDYYIQCSAYAIMLKHVYGKEFPINGCEIWIANGENDIPQVFTMNSKDIYYYGLKLKEKVKNFHKDL